MPLTFPNVNTPREVPLLPRRLQPTPESPLVGNVGPKVNYRPKLSAALSTEKLLLGLAAIKISGRWTCWSRKTSLAVKRLKNLIKLLPLPLLTGCRPTVLSTYVFPTSLKQHPPITCPPMKTYLIRMDASEALFIRLTLLLWLKSKAQQSRPVNKLLRP